MQKLKLWGRIRGAIRGFKAPQSKQVGSLIFGVDVKKCSECENNTSRALYLCDGEDPKCACHLKDEFCHHTTDISHARNFKNVMNPGDNALYVEMDEEDKEGKTDES